MHIPGSDIPPCAVHSIQHRSPAPPNRADLFESQHIVSSESITYALDPAAASYTVDGGESALAIRNWLRSVIPAKRPVLRPLAPGGPRPPGDASCPKKPPHAPRKIHLAKNPLPSLLPPGSHSRNPFKKRSLNRHK